MTCFEQRGINRQYLANNKHEAIRLFEGSCYACCIRGRHASCDNCAIAVAHRDVIAIFEDTEKRALCITHEEDNAC